MNESAKSLELEQVWESRFQELCAFKVATGHLDLAKETANPASSTLQSWVKTQRKLLRDGRLQVNRKEKLDGIGFDWAPHDTIWTNWFQVYKDFVAKHGRGDVAYIKPFDKALSIWVNHQKCALGQGRMPALRARELADAGMTPATRTERKKHSEADQARQQTIQELAAYVAAHGHAQMPSSKDPASLFVRVQKMRHIKDKRKNNWFVSELQRLGAFETLPSAAWESSFSDWKSYVAETGDYACVQNPPLALGNWVTSVRAELLTLTVDPLSLPLADRRAALVKSDAWLSAARAKNRLLTAGFIVEPCSLNERDMVRRKVARLCGVVPSVFLPMRQLLRLVSARTRAGLLSDDISSKLRALGFEADVRSSKWRTSEGSDHVLGALELAHPEFVRIAPMRTHAGVTRRSRARFRQEHAERSITRVPVYAEMASDSAEPPKLLLEVRRQMEFAERPTTPEALLRRPSVQRVLSSDDEESNREELNRVIDELVNYGYLEFVSGPQIEASMRKIQRAAHAE